MAPVAASQKDQVRPTAGYHPSIWGDYFITRHSCHEVKAWAEQIEVLKEEVRRMIINTAIKPSQKLLNLVDQIQRLGIAYHFEEEIEEAIKIIQKSYQDKENDEDLYTVALRFRLIRQQGYKISSDIFNKFKDGSGYFKEEIVNDVRSMLSLYEASYLRVHGEDILDEALEFTKGHLSSMVSHLSSPLADQVSHALKLPIRKALPRKEAWYYFSIYSQDKAHNEALLKLAKLDFNMLQNMHQKELSDITKWWKDLDFKTKLPFARDRLIEACSWGFLALPEPKFVMASRFLVKFVYLITIMDDIYDAHGSIEELELFTKAAERWDIGSKDELPDYLKIFYQALLDYYGEIDSETTKEGRSFCVHYVKEAMKNQAIAYLAEARWLNQGYVPTLEEYLRVSLISATYPILFTIAYCGMGEIASKEVFDWLVAEPKILMAASLHTRLTDDIVGHKFEQQRGHVASAVQCYMKQYGVSEEEAETELTKMIENSWKDMNEELLKPVDVPMPILAYILGSVRAIEAVYKGIDNYTHAQTELKDLLTVLLVTPVPV